MGKARRRGGAVVSAGVAIELPDDGPALVALWQQLEAKIETASFPQLTVEEVTDDGETWTALRCPTCGSLVDDNSVYAVDTDVRWSPVGVDDADFDHETVEVYGGDTEYGSTLFYWHDATWEGSPRHAVALPDGWKGDWS